MLRESLSTPDEQIDEYFDAQVTLTVSYQDTIGKSYLSTSEDNTKIRLAQNSTEGSGGVESHSQKQVLLKNWKMQRAYRTAFREAQEEAKEHFNRCVACERWVCNEDFSPDYGLCVECDRDGKREKRSMK